MTNEDLIKALHGLKVETGSLACFGCGHEHNCSNHGCAILNQAATAIETFNAHFNEASILKPAAQALDTTPEQLRELATEGGAQ